MNLNCCIDEYIDAYASPYPRYRDEIGRMIQGIQDVMRDANLDPSNTQWTSASRILQSLKPLLLVVDNEDFSNAEDSRVPHQLLRLQQEFREYEEKTISDKLQQFGSYLADSASIAAVVGDTRIELVRVASTLLYAYIHLLIADFAASDGPVIHPGEAYSRTDLKSCRTAKHQL